MKFTVNQKELLTNLLIVNKAVSNKNIQPLLSGIYLEATSNNKLVIRGTDMELGIESEISSFVEETGKIVVPSKYLVELVRKMPMVDLEFTTGESNQIKISYGVSEVKLNYYEGGEYPSIHDFEGECFLKLKGNDLINAIVLTQVVVSTDSTRPIFTGTLIEIKDKIVNFVSSDTHRLCHTYIDEMETNTDSWEAIVPAKSLKEVSYIIDEDDDIEIHFTNNRVLFKIKNVKIVSRLIEGKFVNYQQVIPKEFNTDINIIKKSLLDSLERAFVLTRDELKSRLNTVKFNIKEKVMILSSRASEIGDIYEEIPIYLEGNEIELGFNGKYLIEILRNIESDEIKLKLNDPQSPGIIMGNEANQKFIYLILPVRLQ